ncbi:MAG TPA: RNA polymerase sigma factor [Acidimicrobiales bacterium]|nr:RNA polymerase sigma factor [Acidimicrobiales bacterium]
MTTEATVGAGTAGFGRRSALSAEADRELGERMLAWQGGDDAAGVTMERFLFNHLCGIFRARHGKNDAEDMAQEAIIKIWNARNFDPRKGSCDHPFLAWVATIARRLSLDKWEREGHSREKWDAFAAQEERALPATPEDVVVRDRERVEACRLVHECLAELTADHREVLELHAQELSNRDIAGVLEIKVNTVGTRLYRGRKKFEEELGRRQFRYVTRDIDPPPGAVVFAYFASGTLVRLPPEE